jgi:hypothetical protein
LGGSLPDKLPVGAKCVSAQQCRTNICTRGQCQAFRDISPSTPRSSRRDEDRKTSRSSSDAEAEKEPAQPPREEKVYDDAADPVALDDCGKQLREGPYADSGRFADHYAAESCQENDALTLARGYELWKAGVSGKNFSLTLQAIKGHSGEEIACTKKLMLQIPPDVLKKELQNFYIAEWCKPDDMTITLDACGEDLVKQKLTRRKEATETCKRFKPQIIAKAKTLSVDGFRQHDFYNLCRVIDGQSDDEIDCAKKAFANNKQKIWVDDTCKAKKK